MNGKRRKTRQILAVEGKNKNDQAILNAALESLLLHARSIREFFSASGRDNDILAIRFPPLGSAVKVRMPYLRRNKKTSGSDALLTLVTRAHTWRPNGMFAA